MERVIACDCGFEGRAADEAGLVAEVKRHASEAHGMELSDDQALLLVLRTVHETQATAARQPRREER